MMCCKIKQAPTCSPAERNNRRNAVSAAADAYELLVVGAGPAGLATAVEAWERGLRKILVVE
ncbi:MAG: FAD-binding protein, partial [Treponema sp.]|nr:FAD-binding protein [Treponema sp.]